VIDEGSAVCAAGDQNGQGSKEIKQRSPQTKSDQIICPSVGVWSDAEGRARAGGWQEGLAANSGSSVEAFRLHHEVLFHRPVLHNAPLSGRPRTITHYGIRILGLSLAKETRWLLQAF
jgi:hypothetical protein